MTIASYSKILALGHRALEGFLREPVTVEEKVDGSQFSFGIYGGELRCRSRGAEVNVHAPDSLFREAVATVWELAPKLHDGWTFRGEYLRKAKHNTIAYARIPEKHIVLFDIDTGDQHYMTHGEKCAIACTLGLECVPLLHFGKVASADDVRGFLERESFLGGAKIEGVVIKNYARFGQDGKAMMAKFVSEAFKEANGASFRARNPTSGDIKDILIERFRTEARWRKAIQHLTEAGELEGSPRDIGKLIPEIQRDIDEECAEEIKDALYAWAIGNVRRGAVAGFAEFYKQQLLEQQFEPGV